MKKISLLAGCLLISAMSFGQGTDLFISEVVEGTGPNNNDKAVEFFNPTSQPINISQYSIRRYSNGGSTPFQDEILMSTTGGSNMLQPGDVWVMIHPAASHPQILAASDQVSAAYDAGVGGSVILSGGAINANGNDAYELVKWIGGAPGSAGAIAQTVDIFGKIGEDPGAGGWNGVQVGPPTTISSANHSIMRKGSVFFGVTQNPATFDITQEWVAYSVSNFGDPNLPEQEYSRLGEHSDYEGVIVSAPGNAAASFTRVYPNPASGSVKVEFSEMGSGTVEVYNTLGQQVQSVRNVNGSTVLNLAGYNAGLYVVKFVTGNGAATYHNLIVQ